jgi:protein-tyrosine phosphatase
MSNAAVSSVLLLFFFNLVSTQPPVLEPRRNLNVHEVWRSTLTGSVLLRGAMPITTSEHYALPPLRAAITSALSKPIATNYRLLIVSLLRMSLAPPVRTAHAPHHVCAGFFKYRVVSPDKAHHTVDDSHLQDCLRAARRAGVGSDERRVQFVARFGCVLPAGWYLHEPELAPDQKLGRAIYCNVDTREAVLTRQFDATAIAEHLPDILYVDRHHKDFARAELEWRFVVEHGAAERLEWLSLPILGESLAPEATFAHNETLGIALAASLEDWQPDQLVARVRRLRRQLDTESNMCLYVHCEAGIDRTGELIGAFELSLGASWRDVMERAHRYSDNRELKASNLHALQWYCLYERHGAPKRGELDCFDTPQAERTASGSNED